MTAAPESQVTDHAGCHCAELRDLVDRLQGSIDSLRRDLAARPCAPPAAPALMIETGNVRVTIGDVVDLVSREFQVPVREILGSRRTSTVTRARQTACYLSTLLPDVTLVEIGQHIGGLDHTTVMYARDRTRERLRLDPEFARCVARIIDAISPEEPAGSLFATSNEATKREKSSPAQHGVGSVRGPCPRPLTRPAAAPEAHAGA